MRYFGLIFRNALRNRRRSLLTISSLAMSLCVLGVLMALYYALFQSEAPETQMLRVVTRHKVSIAFAMPVYYRDRIANVRGVKQVCTWQWFGGLYKDEDRDRSKFFPRFGVEADRFFDVYPDFRVPVEQQLAFKRDIASALVGQSLARSQGLKIGDTVRIRGNIFPFDLDLTVRAIYDSDLGSDNLYFPLKYIEEALKARGSRRSYAGTFTALVDTPEDIPRVSKAIDEMFANAEEPTHTESEYAFGLSFLSFLGNIKVALLSVCGAVTFTILLIAGNTMAMSVRERVREVGILKTLGFTPGMVLGLLLGESAVIALLGGGVGLVLANGLIGVLRHGPAIVQQTKTLTLQPPVLAVLIGFSVFIGLSSALVPAWKASRTPILEALKDAD
jgi:putative ABC transport system permease protein